MSAIPLPVPTMVLRGASVVDVEAMSRMINGYAAVGLMRARTPDELSGRLSEFEVATEEDGRIAACGGLSRDGSHRAEIVSLAVREDLRGRGLGGRVLDRLVEQAEAHGIETLLATTRRERFFRLRGFCPVRRDALDEGLLRGPGGRRVIMKRRLDGPTAQRGLISC